MKTNFSTTFNDYKDDYSKLQGMYILNESEFNNLYC
jgi:hypothetical protein